MQPARSLRIFKSNRAFVPAKGASKDPDHAAASIASAIFSEVIKVGDRRFKRRVEVRVPYRTLVRPNKARPKHPFLRRA
jgi:hypothetical protein